MTPFCDVTSSKIPIGIFSRAGCPICGRLAILSFALGYRERDWSARTIRLPRCQNLYTRLRDQQRMFELRTQLPIFGHTSPIIRPGLVRTSSQTDHRLYRKGHTGFQTIDGLVLRVVRYVGCAVE